MWRLVLETLKILTYTYTRLNTVVMPGATEPRRTQAHPSPKTSGQPMKSRYQLSQSGVVPLYLSRGSGGDRIRGWTKSDEDPRAKIGHNTYSPRVEHRYFRGKLPIFGETLSSHLPFRLEEGSSGLFYRFFVDISAILRAVEFIFVALRSVSLAGL